MKIFKLIPLVMLLSLAGCAGGNANGGNGGQGGGGNGGESAMTYNQWVKKIEAAPEHTYSSATITRSYDVYDADGQSNSSEVAANLTVNANGKFEGSGAGEEYAYYVNLKNRIVTDFDKTVSLDYYRSQYDGLEPTLKSSYSADNNKFVASYTITGTGEAEFDATKVGHIDSFNYTAKYTFNQYGYLTEWSDGYEYRLSGTNGEIHRKFITVDTFAYQ